MKNLLLLFFCGLTHIGLSHAGEYCTDYARDNVHFYCKTDCCGSWPYEECCTAWIGWAIAGGVIGGILLISLIVCVVCVCVKQKGKAGRVIQPDQATAVSYTTTYMQSPVYYPQYNTPGFAQEASLQPPEYQSLYGQQAPPPLPVGFQGQQQQPQQGQQPLNPQSLQPIGFEGR